MSYFSDRLCEGLEEVSFTHDELRERGEGRIDPDDLQHYGKDRSAFYYIPSDGGGDLVIAHESEVDDGGAPTHRELEGGRFGGAPMRKLNAMYNKYVGEWMKGFRAHEAKYEDMYENDYDRYLKEYEPYDVEEPGFPEFVEDVLGGLMGRVGRVGGRYIVSLWNDRVASVDLLDDFIDRLRRDGVVPDGPVDVYSPLGMKTFGGDDGDDGEFGREVDPEVAERYRLQRELHLLRGDEKKAALRKLELWNDKKAKHPVGRELERVGELGPGQKWWAPYSDDIVRLAGAISEDI